MVAQVLDLRASHLVITFRLWLPIRDNVDD